VSAAERRRADALMRLALRAAPAERREWAEAMRAEVNHLPDAGAEAFAWGCLWATIRARAGSPAFVLQATRWLLVIGALGWSAGNLWLAERFSAAGASAPAGFAYASAAVYAAGALFTALLGLRATVALTAPLLVGLVAAATGLLLPGPPFEKLYRALALEQCVLIVVVLLIAAGVPRWAAAREEGRR
jgi:hypothetical protein